MRQLNWISIAFAVLTASISISGCSSAPKAAPATPATDHRQPAEAGMLPGTHAMPSQAFLDQETVPRQHTFVLIGNQGKYGYHVSVFLQNHQHQVIVSSNVEIRGKTQAQLEKQLATPNVNGYYTILTDMPRFPLSDIREKRKKVIPSDFYDGIIGLGGIKKDPNTTFKVNDIIFTTPMHVEDKELGNNHYVVFGNAGSSAVRYFMAHLIWGPGNYDHVIEVEFKSPIAIADGEVFSIEGQPDKKPLEVGITYTGRGGNQAPAQFAVKREILSRRVD